MFFIAAGVQHPLRATLVIKPPILDIPASLLQALGCKLSADPRFQVREGGVWGFGGAGLGRLALGVLRVCLGALNPKRALELRPGRGLKMLKMPVFGWGLGGL